MIRLFTATILAGLLLPVTTKGAGTESEAARDGVKPIEFIKVAGQTDEFERESGKLATERASSSDVREFAQQMIKDHTQTTQDLMQAAKEGGLNPPAKPPGLAPDQKKALQMLTDSEKSEFDALYLSFQAKAHSGALGLMKGYSTNGTNQALVKAAEKTAPMIQDHLDQIHKIQRSMK
jgi:putative membrane protein